VSAALHDNRIEGAAALPEVPRINVDKVALEALLRRFEGRVTELARHLGVSRPKLYRLLWAADLDPASFRHS
jgi:DNA-binding NtrC family response regulator